MKFSARNVFRGKIVSLKKGPVNSEVIIKTSEGLEIVSTITTESAERMGLANGSDATALIKATQVMLVSE
ncbi:MAG: TOBE domain-containing protein [Desulfobacterales bacterium]